MSSRRWLDAADRAYPPGAFARQHNTPRKDSHNGLSSPPAPMADDTGMTNEIGGNMDRKCDFPTVRNADDREREEVIDGYRYVFVNPNRVTSSVDGPTGIDRPPADDTGMTNEIGGAMTCDFPTVSGRMCRHAAKVAWFRGDTIVKAGCRQHGTARQGVAEMLLPRPWEYDCKVDLSSHIHIAGTGERCSSETRHGGAA